MHQQQQKQQQCQSLSLSSARTKRGFFLCVIVRYIRQGSRRSCGWKNDLTNIMNKIFLSFLTLPVNVLVAATAAAAVI
jgi:hypothetical protein